jgi:hypothetical protein
VDRTALRLYVAVRLDHHTQQPLPWRHWLKWLAVIDLNRQLICLDKGIY